VKNTSLLSQYIKQTSLEWHSVKHSNLSC